MGGESSNIERPPLPIVVVALKENANNEKCKLVWVSFGIFMNLLPFLDSYQILCLQSANKFCYKIAISRVQHNILVPETYYFT